MASPSYLLLISYLQETSTTLHELSPRPSNKEVNSLMQRTLSRLRMFCQIIRAKVIGIHILKQHEC